MQWLKDGVLLVTTLDTSIEKSGDYIMSPTGRYLTVKSAQLRHAGDYTCQAVNKAGSDDKKFNVNVRGLFVGT